MEKTFGLITEGVTDQIVIKNILIGWTGNKNLFVGILQPKENEPGNWDKVFKYCQSNDFKGAFGFYDFVIIQIDTDFMTSDGVNENIRININHLSVEEIVEEFKSKLIELIGLHFYENYKNQIIFAISVHEIECWLLPVYFQNNNKKAAKTKNCIGTLNTVLIQKEGFYIDEKRIEYYEKMSSYFRKKKELKKYYPKNLSFKIFVEDLISKIS